MKKAPAVAISFPTKSYYLLTKPGIIMGNLIAMTGGFFLASKGNYDWLLFFFCLLGLGLVIASSCVLNNFIDRKADQKMLRTKNRALATGSIDATKAFFFSGFLGVSGILFLSYFTNPLAVFLSILGFFIYVILYSFSKYVSSHGTLIGSVAGAMPPVIGYCAVSHEFDLAAWIFFLLLCFWQMPHFFAIAIYRIHDYRAASIPVLPVKKGIYPTKLQMIFYIGAFWIAASMLTFFGYTNFFYLAIVTISSFIWFVLGLQGFQKRNDQLWARKMFLFSLVVILSLNLLIPFTVNYP